LCRSLEPHNINNSVWNNVSVRPTKPPPPPRSLPPVAKLPLKLSTEITDYPEAPKTCDSSASDEAYEPVNFSAPECDHSSPEMARLTSMQYYGSETESEIYPTIQFGDDVSYDLVYYHSNNIVQTDSSNALTPRVFDLNSNFRNL